MSQTSSVDLGEFRSGGGDRQFNDYAYADPMEEMGRGPRHGGRNHRQHKSNGHPRRSSGQPMLVPPGHGPHHYPQGPIITTPSMEMSLSRHPVTHQPRGIHYPPSTHYPREPHHPQGPFPGYPHTNNYGYPQQVNCGQSTDIMVMFAAVMMFFLCPSSILCSLPAVCCLFQGQQLDNQGRPIEGTARRNYALALVCLGAVFGLILEVSVLVVIYVIYWA